MTDRAKEATDEWIKHLMGKAFYHGNAHEMILNTEAEWRKLASIFSNHINAEVEEKTAELKQQLEDAKKERDELHRIATMPPHELPDDLEIAGTTAAECRLINAYNSRYSLRAGIENITKLRLQLAETKGQLQAVHSHVAEALQLLGVDISVDGYVPDSWTLREQCHLAKQQLDERERQVETVREICHELLKDVYDLSPTELKKLAKASLSPAVKECLATEAPSPPMPINAALDEHAMTEREADDLERIMAKPLAQTTRDAKACPAPPMGESSKTTVSKLLDSLDYSLLDNFLVAQAFGVMRELRAWIEEHSEGMSSTPTVSVEASQHQLTVSIGAFIVWGSEANDSSELTLEWCLQEYIAEIENLRLLANNHAALSGAAEGEGE